MRAWPAWKAWPSQGAGAVPRPREGWVRHGSRRSGGRCDGVGVTVSGRVPGPKPPRFGNVVRIAFRAGHVATPSPPANTGRTGRVHSGRAVPGSGRLRSRPGGVPISERIDAGARNHILVYTGMG